MTNRIAYHRKRVGMSQRDLARVLGVPQSRVNEWENDKAVPRLETAIRIAQALGVNVEEVWVSTSISDKCPK